jgi:hypothetical protein
MWFYAFLFLTVLTAVACSVTALIKLMREHHNLVGNFNIPNDAEYTDTANSQIQKCLKSQSNIFRRVVTRCVIYPLGNLPHNYIHTHIHKYTYTAKLNRIYSTIYK